MSRRERLWPTAVAALTAMFVISPVGHADAAKSPPPKAQPADADDELLEFLGTVGAEDDNEDWLDYLSSTDIAKVAKAQPPRSGEKK